MPTNNASARFPGRASGFCRKLFLLLVLSFGIVHAQVAPPNVVATVGMIGDVAAELAGSCAQVRTLMGPGSDPHLYRASAGDVRLLERADMVLYSGLHLEAGLARVLEGFSSRTPTVAVAESAVPESSRLSSVGNVFDPHVWMDVALWHGAAGVIADALTRASSATGACAEQIAERHAAYGALLEDLDAWSRAAIATIPERQRVLVTAHDAFAYFGRAYGIEVEGIQGISTETEAAVADIRRVAQLMVDRGIPALFVESTINPRTVTAVLEAVRQRGGEAELGSELYADALGAAGTPEGTYVGMVLHNVRAITAALGGQLPALPATLVAWEARW